MYFKNLLVLFLLCFLFACSYTLSDVHLEPSYVCECENVIPVATWNYEGKNRQFKVKTATDETIASGKAKDETCTFNRSARVEDLFGGRYFKIYVKKKYRTGDDFYYLILSETPKESEAFRTTYDIEEKTVTAEDTTTYPDGTTITKNRQYTEYRVMSAYVELKEAWFQYPEKIKVIKIKILNQPGLLEPPKFRLINPDGITYNLTIEAGKEYDIPRISPVGTWRLEGKYGGPLFRYTKGSFIVDTFKIVFYVICEE